MINCLMIDLKQDYRHLIRRLPNTLVFRCSEKETPYSFAWNPLEPPLTPESWIPVFSDITSESYFFYAGTASYISEHLYKLYKETKPDFPTLVQLQDRIEKDKLPLIKRDARYRESALNRLNSLISSAGKTLGYSKGYRLGELLEKHNVVIELDNLGRAGRTYFTTLILAHIFQSRILDRQNIKPILVIVDEANEIFNREIERQRGDLTISALAREVREFRIGLIASCQLPDAISNSVKNCYTKIMMSLTEGENLHKFSYSLGLTPEQKETAWQLQTGQAIVRFSRHKAPFAVIFPPYEIQKNVSNEELARHMETFSDELGIVKQEQKEQNFNIPALSSPEPEEKTGQEIKADEKSFLMQVYLKPFLSVTEHYTELGLSAGKGNRVFKSLIRKQFCDVVQINLGGRGGLTKFLRLTQKAYEAIAMPEKKHISKGGGFEHEFWQCKITEYFKTLGYKAEIEKIIGTKSIDIVIQTKQDESITAIEIAMTAEHEKENIEKDIENSCSKIIVACKNKEVKDEVDEILEKLKPGSAGKVKTCIVSELLKKEVMEK